MKKGHHGPKNPLRTELEELKKQGVELLLDGQPGTPKRISRACKIAEEGDYMRDYIACLEKAAKDGTEVKGYFAWSLLDNFEWACGFKERFGLIHVNYETGKRTLKESAKWYSDFIKKNGK